MLKPTIVTLWEMTGYADAIVFIGAGGKTTALQVMAKEINAEGKKVIGTTTTKVYPMTAPFWNPWKHSDSPPTVGIKSPCFWYEEKVENKWLGPSLEKVDQALKERITGNTIWVIEGDGAREKLLKCWGEHEPQIPSQSQCAILVVSGALWGKILTAEEVHRLEKYPELLGMPWTPERAAEYILNSPVFKGEYQGFSWVVLFNTFNEAVDDKVEKNEVEHRLYSWDKCEKTIQSILINTHNINNRKKPRHLRLAAGDVKKGILTCYDLW